ncbi:MAG: cytochrome C oxidase subunit IV family protein [Candidatus Acidiferrales bacterium]
MSEHVVPVKTYLIVFVALMILTALTTGVAFFDLGRFNAVVALAIAVTKMLLVLLFFMHLKYSVGMTRLTIFVGFFFLAILVAFTLSDELTRGWSPTPETWNALVPLARGLF